VDFIVRMDADDVSVPNRIETQVHYMLQNPTVSIAGSSVLLFKDDGQKFEFKPDGQYKVVTYPTEDGMIKLNMLFYCCLAHPSLIIRASQFNYKYSTDNTEGPFPEDYDLWLKLSQSNSEIQFANIGTILVYLRKHSGNISTITKDTEQKRLSIEAKIKAGYLQNYVLDKEDLNEEVVKEFILICGRRLVSKQTFANLKHSQVL